MTPDKKLREEEEKKRKKDEEAAEAAGFKSLRGGEDLRKILP